MKAGQEFYKITNTKGVNGGDTENFSGDIESGLSTIIIV
jgi:hypothetical protein